MLTEPLIQQLHALRLHGMAAALHSSSPRLTAPMLASRNAWAS